MKRRTNRTFTLDHYVYENFIDLIYSPPKQSASIWIEERMAEFLREYGIDPYPDSPKMKETFNET